MNIVNRFNKAWRAFKRTWIFEKDPGRECNRVRKEIELAISNLKKNAENDDLMVDYTIMCYESALEVYEVMAAQGHSGLSWCATKNILNRLMNSHPLTPIDNMETDPYNWEFSFKSGYNGIHHYRCIRRGSLWCDVTPDLEVSYCDNDRFIFKSITDKVSFFNGHLTNEMTKIIPITFPYMPEETPIVVYTDECLSDPNNGDFDTKALLYYIDEEGRCRDINKYYVETDDGYKEITKDEFVARKEMEMNWRKEKENESSKKM